MGGAINNRVNKQDKRLIMLWIVYAIISIMTVWVCVWDIKCFFTS